jgi:hypothetical protein
MPSACVLNSSGDDLWKMPATDQRDFRWADVLIQIAIALETGCCGQNADRRLFDHYCLPSVRFDHHGSPTPPSIVSVVPVM